MAKLLSYIIFLFFLAGITPIPVMAHVVKSDRDISVLLHIGPADAPIAGEQSTFYTELTDQNKRFKREMCDCTLKIIESSKEIFSAALPSSENPVIPYIFTQPGIYIVKIEGHSTNDKFQEFSIDFPVRVEAASSEASTPPVAKENIFSKFWYIFLFVGAGLAIVVMYFPILSYGRKKR